LSDRKRTTPQIFRPGDGRRTHCANTTPSSDVQDGRLSAQCDSQPEDFLRRDDVDAQCNSALVAVATFVGVAFLFGGITQLVVASRVPALRWLNIVGGILGVAAGIGTFLWPGITLYTVSILVAWYLIAFGTIHLVNALAGPKLSWWWTGLLLGTSELVLGVWSARSWEHSLFTMVTVVGVWAICRGVNEIFAGFTLREAGKQADQLVA
jgi:uncharacterized membrane protein HdeD (DUF308 family)